ncbi:Gfo/Idh/MocA family protein [Lachnobacterium bovis]|uniref:Predicted dehydrogenase n=1 Tax=Lachnobacterium bovis DSM 14045 TaxID=1122142 RepID=A0A1H3IU59_9FIRM|nr:Gfo/Idh/MocA family oxidoreductase [Lachnobacterium bovis]SDY31230.1 Predicted dehydrogenase [Lachnobacterium bovis DSM 14045]
MNDKGEVCLGVAGAGRATELHMNALKRFGGVPVCYKHIIARRFEQVQVMKDRYGFINSSLNFDDLLNDPEIDVIDICTPPYVHEIMIERALKAGKHVICEKPLSGYFGSEGDEEPIGTKVLKALMYERVLENLERLRQTVETSDKMFMYAENFVYAPAIVKAAEIIKKKKSKILFAKGEESLKGSSSPVAGEWSKTGGGTFIRTGAHPLTAILWLKSVEAQTRGEKIKVVSVYADMETITNQLTDYEHRHIAARPHDVEDFGAVILTFSDKTKAMIMATDTLLGGSKNYVELYCNDAAINCKLTMANFMETYFLDEDRLDDVYISEMLPQKTGWNCPFLEDEIIRGYTDEMRDFIESIYYHRMPKSGFNLAYDTVKVIYAAYKSAELKMPVEL